MEKHMPIKTSLCYALSDGGKDKCTHCKTQKKIYLYEERRQFDLEQSKWIHISTWNMKHVFRYLKKISLVSRGNCFLSICLLKRTQVENISSSYFHGKYHF